jgi:CDP-paratose 2-epimerase
LIKCAIEGTPYEVIGYKGKQVRDNIHADDLVDAFMKFHSNPRGGEVYNMGGGRESNCSVLEAIELAEKLLNSKMTVSYNKHSRIGDHRWYITDLSKFKSHYPNWKITKSIEDIFNEYTD